VVSPLKSTSFLTGFALAVVLTTLPAGAQFSYRSTVGNASQNQFQPGASVAIKYRGAVISNPASGTDNANAGVFTRHAPLGNSTGIGGSTFQTTAVTSESRPALLRPTSLSTGAPLISRPQLNLQFQSAAASPALTGFTPSLPDLGGEDFFGRGAESFTSASPATSTSRYSSGFSELRFGD
jgi:hypothetical protein